VVNVAPQGDIRSRRGSPTAGGSARHREGLVARDVHGDKTVNGVYTARLHLTTFRIPPPPRNAFRSTPFESPQHCPGSSTFHVTDSEQRHVINNG